ncbi:serine-enriched protein-like [Mercenaria mercenaria]|uniref:serine-enriched protein-like n=1 Tax=Mercenaria mercenaria TaxID=6596 RepID=UPI00234E7E02|nr:serine-enriched protein-like [Mercenaria mercenaria]
MHSYGSSSSDSDISSNSGSMCFETDGSFQRKRRRRIRQDSITSVSTNPEEEAYVMVLQNRQGLYDDIRSMTTLKDINDVTFLAGEEQKPVDGVRTLISTRNRLLGQLISSFEKNKKVAVCAKRSKLRKTINKLNKLSCVHTSRRENDKQSDLKKKLLIIPMKAFDHESFQRFINYIHCGTLTIDSGTVIGLLNAAYMFDVPEVRQACWDFALGCVVRTDNLNDLFTSARKYTDHKMTNELMKTMKKYSVEHPHILEHSRSLSELAKAVFKELEPEVTLSVT